MRLSHALATRCAALALMALALPMVGAAPAHAAGDLMKGRTALPAIELGDGKQNDYAVSGQTIELETGKGYRLNITAKGEKEYKFMAPGFFRSVWVDQIVVNKLEIHMAGPPAWLEFDDQGTIEVNFTPVKTGTYEWWVDGLKDKGMVGKFVVK
ncbi:hypothetical protein [Methyloraptor flagellatus]|jgi:hypothetical protein|uniref:Copper-binding protein n=1 Tax=Methyloraptor flagellatus TaxID=3162530 RepID=A0AAU7X5C6_9HYPH